MEKEDDPVTMLRDQIVESLLLPGEAQYILGIIESVRELLKKESKSAPVANLKSAMASINTSCIRLQDPYAPQLAPQTLAYKELIGLVAYIANGVRAVWRYYPRNAQLIAFIMLLTGRVRRTNTSRGGRLIQMNTGEGKTVVVAMSAVAFCLLGHRVDVVTSSESLAERDATLVRQFVDYFKLTVDHVADEIPKKQEKAILYEMIGDNCAYQFSSHMISLWCGLIRQELNDGSFDRNKHRALYCGPEELVHAAWRNAFPWYNGPLPAPKSGYLRYDTYNPKKCYRADIVYGTAMGFQGDLLRHQLRNHGTRDVDGIMRPFDVVICDECDALMSDGALHSTQLSSDVFGMSYLNQIIAVVCAQYLGGRLRGIRDDRAEKGVKMLSEPELAEHVTKVVREALLNGKDKTSEDKVFQIRVPPYLTEFALEQCPRIVESVCTAFFKWRERYEYHIKDYDGEGLRPVPLNIGTGEAQVRMQYANGLHEALQIKHKLPLGQMTLCDNQRSNKLMFQEYSYIFGLSGTLGSKEEHNYLKTSYSVDIRVVAPFKRNRRETNPGEIHMCLSDWTDAIARGVSKFAATRAVLIICKYESMVNMIFNLLKDNTATQHYNIITYVDKTSQQLPSRMNVGDVLISTNLAGRGTDLEISNALANNGGLHTILAFLADNERIRDQAFGRSGRCGQRGSAQVIGFFHHSPISNICGDVSHAKPHERYKYLERVATEVEKIRLQELPTTTLGADTSERCFVRLLQAINDTASKFRRDMKAQEASRTPEAHDTILRNFDNFCVGSVLERFAFWKKQNEERFDEFSAELRSEFESQRLPELKNLLDALIQRIESADFTNYPINPYRLIDKGLNHAYAEQHDLAIELYNASIKQNPDFCAFAHYNKALSLIEKGRFDEAKNSLDAAYKQIEEGELPRICATATMLSNLPRDQNYPSGDDDLAKQLELHTTILSAVLTNIGEAKQTLDQLIADEHTPGAYFASSTESTKFNFQKDIPSISMTMYYHNLGLRNFIKVYCKKKKSNCFWDAVLCGLIGVVQVVGGAILTYMSAGVLAQVGYALIMEGISDIAYAVEHGIAGDFRWSNWATKKAVSLAVTALTLGLGGFSGVASGTSAFQMIGKAVVKELITRGVDWLVGSVLQEVIKKIIELLGNELRGLMQGAVQNILRTAEHAYNKCVDAALLFQAMPESEESFSILMEHMQNIVRNVLARPSILSTIGSIADGVLNKVNEIKSSNETVTAVVKIVAQVAKAVGIAAKANEIIRAISGIGSAIRTSLEELTKKFNFDDIYELAASAKEYLRPVVQSDFDNLIASLQSQSVLNAAGQLTSNYAAKLESSNYAAKTKQQLKEIFGEYEKQRAMKNAMLDATKRREITDQVINGWSASVSTFVLDGLTKRLQGEAMAQLRDVANQFSNEFVQSSQQVQRVLATHNLHQQSISRLLNTNGNPLAIASVLSSVATQVSPNSPLSGTIHVATLTTVVDRIQHGDVNSAINLFGSSAVGQQLVAAISTSQLGQEVSAVMTQLGELPHQKLHMMASASLSLIKGDLNGAVVGLGQIVDDPNVHKIVSISQHLHRGDVDTALREAAYLANVDLTSLPVALPSSAIKDLQQVVDATVAIEQGDYTKAIKSLAKTQLGEKVVEFSNQCVAQIHPAVTQISEIKNITTLVQNLNIVPALELTVSSKLLPGQVLSSKRIASVINACQTFSDLCKNYNNGCLHCIVKPAAELIDANPTVVNAIETLFSRQWFKEFPQRSHWPQSSLVATTEDCAMLVQFLTKQSMVAKQQARYTLQQCRQLFDVVQAVCESESVEDIERLLAGGHDEVLVKMICRLALPKLLQNKPHLAPSVLNKLFTLFNIRCTLQFEDTMAFVFALRNCISIGDNLLNGKVDEALTQLKGLDPEKFKDLSSALTKVKRVTEIGTSIVKGDVTEAAKALTNQPEFQDALNSIQVAKECFVLKRLFQDFRQSTESTLLTTWHKLIAYVTQQEEIRRVLSLTDSLLASLQQLDRPILRRIIALVPNPSNGLLISRDLNLNREMTTFLQSLFDIALVCNERSSKGKTMNNQQDINEEVDDPDILEAIKLSMAPTIQLDQIKGDQTNAQLINNNNECITDKKRKREWNEAHEETPRKKKQVILEEEYIDSDMEEAVRQSLLLTPKQLNDIRQCEQQWKVDNANFDEEQALAEALRRSSQSNQIAQEIPQNRAEELDADLALAIALSLSLAK